MLADPSLDGEAFNFGPNSQQDKTVADLLESMATRWPGAAWEIAVGSEQAGREAALLRLSCDKALRRLDWRAVLQFPETVSLTIDWYRAWHQRDGNLHRLTVDQIERYTHIARSAEIGWATP
jgi:CDP-glucose 4,6-dehydratase